MHISTTTPATPDSTSHPALTKASTMLRDAVEMVAKYTGIRPSMTSTVGKKCCYHRAPPERQCKIRHEQAANVS